MGGGFVGIFVGYLLVCEGMFVIVFEKFEIIGGVCS